jgi:hypothetical protein
MIYSAVCPEKILKDALNGKNAGFIAYGQSGAGKTFTLFGKGRKDKGLVQQALVDTLKLIAIENLHYKLFASMYEIYVEQIKDLGVQVAEEQKKSSNA